jgi:hypothetical protein
MASCYLLTMCDDSIEGIFETLRRCAIISKNAGGIGLAVSCIRANGSYIEGVRIPCKSNLLNILLSYRPTVVRMVFYQ